MSDFVEQCRREWRRLRVPDPVAEEMAADLGADLREAESEGVSAEKLLGSSVFDPRSFAASWAAERGIIPPAPQRETASRKTHALLTLATVSAIALIVGALALLTSHSRVAPVAFTAAPPHLPPAPSAPGPTWRARRDGRRHHVRVDPDTGRDCRARPRWLVDVGPLATAHRGRLSHSGDPTKRHPQTLAQARVPSLTTEQR